MLNENRVDRWAGFAVVLVLILGCFVVLWGPLVVGLVDNLLKPYFIGKGLPTVPL